MNSRTCGTPVGGGMPASSEWDERLNASFCSCVWHSKEAGVSAENGGINWEHLFQTANQYFRNASLKGSNEKI